MTLRTVLNLVYQLRKSALEHTHTRNGDLYHRTLG